jgi:hypothetical protein
MPPLPKDHPVTVYELWDTLPRNHRIIGSINIGDSGFSVNCGWDAVLERALNECRKMGGNALKLVSVIEPSWESSCYRITAHALYISSTNETVSTMSETFINETFKILSENIPNNARIAIVNVNSDNVNESSYIIDELTVLFVNTKHFVVDRNRLKAIMDEQRFQMTGFVDDNTVVSIGHFVGANVVLTGNINYINDRKRLVFRALDVMTSQILAMSSVDM